MAHNDELLLSLPAGSAAAFNTIDPDRAGHMFVTSDPPGTQLGSGGGTAHLLVDGWRGSCRSQEGGNGPNFEDWLRESRKLLIHGSGESRRLPAYAAEGKPLLPLPSTDSESGYRPDQMLLDSQAESYKRFLWHAPDSYRVMVTCGDVLVRFQRWLPAYPEADVLIVGLVASPEEAQRHGVMVCPPDNPGTLSFFLQKPGADTIRTLAESHAYYLDTGIWLLSKRAVSLLMRKCGWSDSEQAFVNGLPDTYDLYAGFGPSLGTVSPPVDSQAIDPDIRDLSCAVLPLADAHFYHFGTNRSLLASVAQLQRPSANQRSFGHSSMEPLIEPVIQNSRVDCTFTGANRHIWIDNSCIAPGWRLSEQNVITGAPANDWDLELQPGDCIDFVPVDAGRVCIRVYGFDDAFRGCIGDSTTSWRGKSAPDWFEARGLAIEQSGMNAGTDIQEAPLFPALAVGDIDPAFIRWMLQSEPGRNAKFESLWTAATRLSSRELLSKADVSAIAEQRCIQLKSGLAALHASTWAETCCRLDLAAAARMLAAGDSALPDPVDDAEDKAGSLARVHDMMFRADVGRLTGKAHSDEYEEKAFDGLRRLIVDETALDPVTPSRNVLDDQIVWGRSPVRLDLAGGWTDTPPYCIEHGGRVVNVAVDLNGQPPIQVFARVAEKPEIVIRSIDLGLEDRVTSYDELLRCNQLGSGFAIARAALALSGMSPRFHAGGGFNSLGDQLKKEFGGGLEISMLAAVPKGSGLGTSSILAATLLGTLSDLCGLYWDSNDLFERTLALEQMLTSGGGWQDQAGGIIGGIKLLETEPGLSQRPVVRWLPGRFFSEEYANTCILLYYTGLTRVAHDILGEIVRKIFLNSSEQLTILKDIGDDALYAADAIQRNDWDGLCEAVRRSWCLNQRLDSGTNPPAVQAVLDRAGDDVLAAKLLGAGGGGYMLIFAANAGAGQRIREKLNASPPNEKARFVNMRISDQGFQVTRS